MFPVLSSLLIVVHHRQHPVSVGLKLRAESLHLLLHLADALVHADDNLDPGEVHAEILDQPLDVPQPSDIRLRVQPLPSVRPTRLDEPNPLVVAEALGVQADQPGRHADNVAGPFVFALVVTHHASSPLSGCCPRASPQNGNWGTPPDPRPGGADLCGCISCNHVGAQHTGIRLHQSRASAHFGIEKRFGGRVCCAPTRRSGDHVPHSSITFVRPRRDPRRNVTSIPSADAFVNRSLISVAAPTVVPSIETMMSCTRRLARAAGEPGTTSSSRTPLACAS